MNTIPDEEFFGFISVLARAHKRVHVSTCLKSYKNIDVFVKILKRKSTVVYEI